MKPITAGKASGKPVLPAGKEDAKPKSIGSNRQPTDEDYAEGGKFVTQIETGEVFALVVIPDDARNRTHKCKNALHFWEGSETEFNDAFREARRKEVGDQTQAPPDDEPEPA